MRFTLNPFTNRLDAFEISSSPTGNVDFLTGNTGGAVPPDGSQNINIIGSGAVTITGNIATNTLDVFSAGGGVLAWTRIPGTTQACAINNAYIPTNVALTTLTLPVTASVGDIIIIAGEGSGGWKIAQNAGQNIQISNDSSTIGVGGYISSTNRYDSIVLVCRVANTTWHAYLAPVGVIKLV